MNVLRFDSMQEYEQWRAQQQTQQDHARQERERVRAEQLQRYRDIWPTLLHQVRIGQPGAVKLARKVASYVRSIGGGDSLRIQLELLVDALRDAQGDAQGEPAPAARGQALQLVGLPDLPLTETE